MSHAHAQVTFQLCAVYQNKQGSKAKSTHQITVGKAEKLQHTTIVEIFHYIPRYILLETVEDEPDGTLAATQP